MRQELGQPLASQPFPIARLGAVYMRQAARSRRSVGRMSVPTGPMRSNRSSGSRTRCMRVAHKLMPFRGGEHWLEAIAAGTVADAQEQARIRFSVTTLRRLKREVAMERTQPRIGARVEATIAVHSSETKPYDQTETPALVEVRLSETFTGDIDGESTVRALQVLRDDRSASLISMQRVRGKLGGRQGSFVLQGSGTVANGKITATWFVVPGSGTGNLSGLRGEGGFEGVFGQGSQGTLHYWFE
jgi:hypothetical protein